MKTRHKLLIVLLLFSLAPLVAASVTSYVMLRNNIRNNVQDQLEAVASIQSTRLQDIVGSDIERIDNAADRMPLRQSLADYVNNHDAGSQATMNADLMDLTSRIKAFKEISVIDMNGIIVASTNPSMIGDNESDTNFFMKSKSGEHYISFIKGENGVLMQQLSGPILLNGSQIGVIYIESTADELTAMVSDYTGLGATGETLVVTKNKQGDALFIHPLRFDRNAAFSSNISKEETGVTANIVLSGKSALISEAKDYRGHKVVAVTRYIEEPGLGLVVKKDISEAYAAINTLSKTMLLIFIVTAVLVIAVSIHVSISITKPITQLTEVAEAISKGDLSKKADEKAGGEFKILARTFNQMTRNLLEARENLEDKVKKRTQALKTATESLEHEIAERELYQKTLEESEFRYRDLFENAGDLIQSIDPEGNILYVNPTWKKTLGYSDEEIKSLRYFDILDPDCLEECMEVFKKVVSGERSGIIEATFIAKDGSKVILEGEASCHFEDGVPVNTRGIFHNITERKISEEYIKQLAALVRSSEDAIIAKDLEGVIKTWNTGAHKIYGYSAEEITGRNISILEPEDLAGETSKLIERIKNGEIVETYDTRRLTKDGQEVNVSITLSPITDDAGNVTGASAVARDITERIHALAALAESEEKFRAIASTANDAIILIDNDDKIAFWNRIAEKLFGYTESEAIGKVLHPLLAPPYYLDAYHKGFARFKETGRGDAIGMTTELEGLRRNGEVFPIELSLSSITLDGRWHALGIIRDITDRKKAEVDLQRINTELEGFAHTVSHDLKGPLTAITIAADTIRELSAQPEDPESREMMDDVVGILDNSIVNARKLIEDLLSLAEAGQQPMEVEDVSIRGIVDRIMNERRSDIEDLGIQFDIDEDLGHMTGNYTQIYQVFANIISNAIKHGVSNNPVFKVAYLGDGDDGGHRYLFCDNGEGIDEKDMDKIFNPFFKGKSGGTGIGLTTVMKIVQLYGGNIRAYNDNGACFEFTLYDFPEISDER